MRIVPVHANNKNVLKHANYKFDSKHASYKNLPEHANHKFVPEGRPVIAHRFSGGYISPTPSAGGIFAPQKS